MVRNRKPNCYSYKNKDVAEVKFLNKNFNKTESYNSRFCDTYFKNTSLVGTKFKFCYLNNVVLDSCYIKGAIFKKCHAENIKFKNCIIISTKFDRISLVSCIIEKSVLLVSPLENGFLKQNLISSDILEDYYPETDFNELLLEKIQSLRDNKFIRRSSVLHRKKGKVNTIALKLLLRDFSEAFLIKNLPLLGNNIQNDFYTLSYLIVMLHKLSERDIV